MREMSNTDVLDKLAEEYPLMKREVREMELIQKHRNMANNDEKIKRSLAIKDDTWRCMECGYELVCVVNYCPCCGVFFEAAAG